MAHHGMNQLVPTSSLGFPTRQWARSACSKQGERVGVRRPLDGIGLLYRNQFRLSPLVGLEGVVQIRSIGVNGTLWPGADAGLMFPAIEPRTVGPLTFVHGGFGIRPWFR
jgi:hypothetical protein